MNLAFSEVVLWYCSIGLECVLCVFIFSRRVHRYLQIFAAYSVLLLARAGLIRWVYGDFGYGSGVALYSFWTTEALLVVTRGLAIGELVWTVSRLYPGFRVVLKWSLGTLAVAFLLLTATVAVTNVSNLPPLILGLERDINLGAVVALLTFFALSQFYGAALDFSRKLIALGFLVYSALQVVNSSDSLSWVRSYFHAWSILWIASFQIAQLFWIAALVKPIPALHSASSPTDVEAVRELVHDGTRLAGELRIRLSALRKTRKA